MVCYDLPRCTRISQDVLIIIATQVHQRKQNVFLFGQVEGLFKMYLGPLGSNQNIVHGKLCMK